MTDLTPEEQYKFEVIQKVIDKEIKPGFAAKLLSVSARQVRRLRNDVLDNGPQAVVHKLKGRVSNHKLDESLKNRALSVVGDKYADFKPTFASEKLLALDGINVHPQTLRRWMTQKGIWKVKRRKKPEYRSWRPRKQYYGELEQFDGSYHLWFEKRCSDQEGNPLEVCLLASIDDATGRITKAKFAENEGTHAVFTFWKEYIKDTGKPEAIYLDKFSTYKINHKAAVDNFELLTQFQKATGQLDIKLITAHSPEAKGRVEKLFGTLQDRLVKEMRLANISTLDEGNKFLKEVFIPDFNSQFSVIPEKEGNVHKALNPVEVKSLNSIFSIKSLRRVNNDFTIQFKNNWYQLLELQRTTIRKKDIVLVEEWLDHRIHFKLKNVYLNYMLLPQRPLKLKKNPSILTTHKLNYKPPPNHPWRKPFKARY